MTKSSKKRTHATPRSSDVVVGRAKTGAYPLTWLLVADGDEANLYRVAPKTYRLSKVDGGKFAHDDLPGSVIKLSNRPHHKLDPHTSPHQAKETAFLRHVAKSLDGLTRDAAVEDLLIVAPPRAMAALRQELSRKLRNKIALEVTHEWVNLPTHVMTKRLVEYLTGREARHHDPREISTWA